MAWLRKRALAVAAALIVALPAQAGTLTVTALGDSLIQGYGLPQEDGFVPVLEEWLRARGHDVIVTNAGVSGDTTAGGRSRIEWTLADGPDALIVTLGGNDLLRGLDPAESRANLAHILQAATQDGIPVLLTGMPAPGNYGPEFKRDFEAIYPELAEEFDALLVEDFLAPISEKAETGQSLGELMQDDRIHPNATGVQQIVERIGPKVEDLLERAAAESQEQG